MGWGLGAEMEVVGTGKIRREETGLGTNINPSPWGTMVVKIRWKKNDIFCYIRK